jgi:hypothetical protein
MNSQPNPFKPPATRSPDPPPRPIAGFLWLMARIVAWAFIAFILLGFAINLSRPVEPTMLRYVALAFVLMICCVITGIDIGRRTKA